MEKSAAILLSRQPIRPTGKTAWVQKAKEAIKWVSKNNLSLFTSVGMSTWEILLVLAKQNKVRQKILITAKNMKDFNSKYQSTVYQFDLNKKIEDFIPVFTDSSSFSKNGLMQKRDRLIIQNTDILIPVSVRTNGLMDRLICEFCNKSIVTEFQVDYDNNTTPLSYRIDEKLLTKNIMDIKSGQYIIHWTRAANSAWPTERLIDYYSTIIEHGIYPRSAFSTLKNIIETRRIVASSKHMPGKIATVSFTALSPHEIVPLIRWRARYLQMSFEPYGIGIERQCALDCNILPVQYYDKKSNFHPGTEDLWLSQSTGTITDWRCEKEFRHRGNFDLSQVPHDKLICFCFTKKEAAVLESVCGIRTVAFVSDC
jgi:hypothetical protein